MWLSGLAFRARGAYSRLPGPKLLIKAVRATQSDPVGGFRTTSRALVLNAFGESAEALTAFRERYRRLMHGFIRHRGFPSGRAQDLTGEFFATIFGKRSFKTADHDRAVTRESDLPLLSLDFRNSESHYTPEAVDTRFHAGRMTVPGSTAFPDQTCGRSPPASS